MNGHMSEWIAILTFGAAFLGIAIWSKFRTKNAQSFATGSGAGPLAIGMSLATTLTSAAVFIVNPGLVYQYGLSAFLSFSVAANFGIIIGLLVLLKGFRKSGIDGGIVSVPQWIQGQYKGDIITRLFYGISTLLLFTYIVLIFVGLTNIITQLLGISIHSALIMLIGFIILYNQIGGANSHVYTNFIQGIVMIVVAIILIVSGIHFFEGGFGNFFNKIGEMSPELLAVTNPKSIMFRDIFEVFFVNVLIGFAIVCQPHILAKGLFLKTSKDVNKMLVYAMVIGTVFSTVMFIGFYARHALTTPVVPDMVVPVYITSNFGKFFQILASIGILCAGLSTLEAILLSFTVTYSFDIIMPVAAHFKLADVTKIETQKKILTMGKVLTVLSGVVIYFLTYEQIVNPNVSVALFAFNGVYALFAATFIPVAAKIFKIELPHRMATLSSLIVLLVHFGMSYLRISIPGLNPYYWTNPGANATFALIAGIAFVTCYKLVELTLSKKVTTEEASS